MLKTLFFIVSIVTCNICLADSCDTLPYNSKKEIPNGMDNMTVDNVVIASKNIMNYIKYCFNEEYAQNNKELLNNLQNSYTKFEKITETVSNYNGMVTDKLSDTVKDIRNNEKMSGLGNFLSALYSEEQYSNNYNYEKKEALESLELTNNWIINNK